MFKKAGGGLGGRAQRLPPTAFGQNRKNKNLRISNEALIVEYSFSNTRIACIVKANQKIRR